MSTAISTHRYSDPLAVAAAIVVILGGASVIGVAMASGDTAAPAAPAQTRVVDEPPSSRIGTGDFQVRQGSHTQPLKGGHSLVGLP